MARGNSTRRNLSPEQISQLLAGNQAALQQQAAKGGNVKPSTPAQPPELPPPLPKKKEAAEKPWWDKENNGILKKMLFGGHGKGDINEMSTDYGAQEELQTLINQKRKALGLKPGQPLPLPQTATVPAGISITGSA